MEQKILDLIKKHKRIIIARHTGGDPDALGSTFAMKEIILNNFPDKEVYVAGTAISRFRFFGTHDKITEEMEDNALLIALDIPDIRRLDGVCFERFSDVIKIDHHPEIDKFSDVEIVDEDASSACELVARWAYKCNLKLTKHAAECIFMGIVSDTNRFLFGANKKETYQTVLMLVDKEGINPNELYEILYKKPLSEVRLEGFISLNMKVTKNGLGYVKITDEQLKELKTTSASVGGLMNNYNFINGLICWTVFTEDKKNNVIRVSARSRGVKINKLFEQYNGGGHVYACGAKLNSFSEADEIIDKLDDLCLEYKQNKE